MNVIGTRITNYVCYSARITKNIICNTIMKVIVQEVLINNGKGIIAQEETIRFNI